MSLIDSLLAAAHGSGKRVALPEADAPNTLKAARAAQDSGIATPVLLGDPAHILPLANDLALSVANLELIDITNEQTQDDIVRSYLPYSDGLISEKGLRRRVKNPVHAALMLEAAGKVDATFCGHTTTTADVLLAAQTLIGLADGVDVPSIVALVEAPYFDGPEGHIIAFADCGLNPEPTAAELASIAISAADTTKGIMKWESRVAFLSFSTTGSGTGSSVDKVQEALRIAQERRKDLAFDGEFQLDSAIDPVVAQKKLTRESAVAGKANVLVFPDLNAANIAVKLVQRFGKGAAYGHTLAGFRLPVADSSRGATPEEMLGDIAMLVLLA